MELWILRLDEYLPTYMTLLEAWAKGCDANIRHINRAAALIYVRAKTSSVEALQYDWIVQVLREPTVKVIGRPSPSRSSQSSPPMVERDNST